LIGNVLDKYEVLQKLGEGGMATVYRGRHLTLGRDVAIKILHPHLSSTERNRIRFAREARAIENMDHENILKIFDYSGEKTEDCYIVTEFVDGVTLQELLADKGRFPGEVACQIGLKLAKALSYAHSMGIIHRDLKPENVMLRRDGTIKLMDFGIARFVDEMHLTVTGALVGSPAYMSPEQALEKNLDHRSDLFSLGTLLFHLVTGERPYSGNNPSIILKNIIDNTRDHVSELSPDISASFSEVIEQLLQSNPEDRPTFANSVVDMLTESLDEVQLYDDSPQWNLQAWLVDPAAYVLSLQEHLRTVLMNEGRNRLENNDHLGALQLFNRLLTIDADHPEVLELVQGMHQLQPQEPTNSRRWGMTLGIPLLASFAAWALWPAAPQQQDPVAAQVNLSEVEPAIEGPIISIAPPIEAVVTEEPTTAVIAPPEPTPEPQSNPVAIPAVNLVQVPIEPVPPIDTTPAQLTVVVPGSWGYIFIDDVQIGRTGQIGTIPLEPGEHELRVENDYSLPWHHTFTVEAGESLEVTVTDLQRKPATAILSDEIDPNCSVSLDGILQGTIQDLGHRLSVTDPDNPHIVELGCPDGTATQIPIAQTSPGSVFQLGTP